MTINFIPYLLASLLNKKILLPNLLASLFNEIIVSYQSLC